jgi:hypothetical protein
MNCNSADSMAGGAVSYWNPTPSLPLYHGEFCRVIEFDDIDTFAFPGVSVTGCR